MSQGYLQLGGTPGVYFIIDNSYGIKRWNLVIKPNRCFERKNVSTDYEYHIYVTKTLVNIDIRKIIEKYNLTTTNDTNDNNTIVSTHYDNSVVVENISDIVATLYMDENNVTCIGGNYGYYKYKLVITVAENYGQFTDMNIEFEKSITGITDPSNIENNEFYKSFNVTISRYGQYSSNPVILLQSLYNLSLVR